MKALLHMAKKIGRFAYPLYFYPNQLKAQVFNRLQTNTTNPYYHQGPYANA